MLSPEAIINDYEMEDVSDTETNISLPLFNPPTIELNLDTNENTFLNSYYEMKRVFVSDVEHWDEVEFVFENTLTYVSSYFGIMLIDFIEDSNSEKYKEIIFLMKSVLTLPEYYFDLFRIFLSRLSLEQLQEFKTRDLHLFYNTIKDSIINLSNVRNEFSNSLELLKFCDKFFSKYYLDKIQLPKKGNKKIIFLSRVWFAKHSESKYTQKFFDFKQNIKIDFEKNQSNIIPFIHEQNSVLNTFVTESKKFGSNIKLTEIITNELLKEYETNVWKVIEEKNKVFKIEK